MSDGGFLDGFHIHVPEDYDADPDAKLGKVMAPYGGIERCALSTCQQELDERESAGAYMFRDLETGKLVILCGECAPGVELNHSDRFLLIPL